MTRPVLLALASAARAQTLEDEVRRVIPDLFAGLLGVTLSEEISGASFRVDNGATADDTHFSTFRIPWSADHALEGIGVAVERQGDVIGHRHRTSSWSDARTS